MFTAGKYNDGTPENRGILAQRLAKGMKQAWETNNPVCCFREKISPGLWNR